MYYYLRALPDDRAARAALKTLAKRLKTAFQESETVDWPWCEDVVTYDNARVPQALILAGLALDDEGLTQRGLRVLPWLLDVQTADEGHLSVIGPPGHWRRKVADRDAPLLRLVSGSERRRRLAH